ncbi:hypothetical protein GW17_00035718 [Ensete ventricosum]|nr:hypothetical protein GW17_00035718 [Ensete ventricosum]RZR93129.1 hypothetical protein BHM03_00021547 [Ensete ventricosum]
MKTDEHRLTSLASRENDDTFSRWKTRRRHVPAQEDEATPRPRAGRRGIASSPRGKTRHRLVRLLKDEAAPRSPAGR